MTKKELIKWLEKEIPNLPTNYNKVYDAVTIEEGIRDCLDVGRRDGYETIYRLLTEN